jgi:hypothetical protein
MFNVKATPGFAPTRNQSLKWVLAALHEAGFARPQISKVKFHTFDLWGKGFQLHLEVILRQGVTFIWDYEAEYYSRWSRENYPLQQGDLNYRVKESTCSMSGEYCELKHSILESVYEDFEKLETKAEELNSSEIIFIRAEDYMGNAETLYNPLYLDGAGNPVKVIHAWAVPLEVYKSGLVNLLNDSFYSVVECPEGLQPYSCNYAYIDAEVVGKSSEGLEPHFQEWEGTASFGAGVHTYSSFDSSLDRWTGAHGDRPLDTGLLCLTYPKTQIMFADRPIKSVIFEEVAS